MGSSSLYSPTDSHPYDDFQCQHQHSKPRQPETDIKWLYVLQCLERGKWSRTKNVPTTVSGLTQPRFQGKCTRWHVLAVSFAVTIQKRLPILVTKCWARSWSWCTGSQPASYLSHPPGGRLSLLSATPAVAFPATEHHRPLAGTYFTVPRRVEGWVNLAI